MTSFANSELPSLETRDYAERRLTGKISHLYHCSDLFSAGILSDPAGSLLDKDCRFNVKSRVQLGEVVTLHGTWKNDPKWGWQFCATLVEYSLPDTSTGEGLREYLQSNPAFRGIGPAKAAKIAAAFGADFDQTIRTDPAAVALAGGITREQAECLRTEWVARADVNAISLWLAQFGLTHHQIRKIAEQYGNRAKPVLEENPYVLIGDLHGFGFGRVDEIALKMGIQKDHPGRIRECLRYLLQTEAENAGHTYTSRRELLRSAIAKLALDTLEADSLVAQSLDSLCESGELVAVETEADYLVSDRTIYEREHDLLRWFHESKDRQIARPWTGKEAEAITAATRERELMPTESQAEAVRMVLQSGISVISGGAGTGKSFTIATVHRIFTQAGLTVGMCAPTGKAAKRMEQLAQAPAHTIHKLLDYNPQLGWGYDAKNKLPYDLVIVDEVSMCDIELSWRLLSAVDFNRTQVLLVGDHNQLPPIGAGNMLRDILAKNLLPCHLLTHCHRAAGQLKQNCNAVLDGEVRPTTPVLPAGGREWRVIDSLDDPELVVESLRMLMESQFEKWGFDPIRDCQVITPFNKGRLGVNRINAELQRVWQHKRYGVHLPEVPTDAEPRLRFLTGDKVMQVKNDRKLDVMNGTSGVIECIEDRPGKDGQLQSTMVVRFEDRGDPAEIAVGSDEAGNLRHAYACSIHKVQGSEYPCVVSIVHRMHAYMLSRNLLYTAVTRARKTAIVLGDRIGMRRAARTTSSVDRRTWMGLSE